MQNGFSPSNHLSQLPTVYITRYKDGISRKLISSSENIDISFVAINNSEAEFQVMKKTLFPDMFQSGFRFGPDISPHLA